MHTPHFYANKAKTEVRRFCLNRYKTRYTPVKRDRKLPALIGFREKSKECLASRTRSERDRNEIEICIIWGHRGTRQGSIPECTKTVLIGVPDVLKHLKNEMHAWKNEIGMNFGNKFPPPLRYTRMHACMHVYIYIYIWFYTTFGPTFFRKMPLPPVL